MSLFFATSSVFRCPAILCLLVAGGVMTSNAVFGQATSENAQRDFFESRIRPVLVEHCYSCHNSRDNAEAGLAVDYRAGIRQSDVVVPGNPKSSRLLAAIKHEIDGAEMPEGGAKLDVEVINDFERWIQQGAFDPRDHPPTSEEISNATSWEKTFTRRKEWWSWQPIESHTPPSIGHPSLHPVDRFVRARLQKEGLQPNERAEVSTLVRRLFVVLIGLPPTVQQHEDWTHRIAQQGQSAIESLIDQLLASPHFGERWARHWMDWVRYAESHGSEGDPAIDNAWMYRDYLIRALNDDVPYDQLLREHVAGDLLEDPRINRRLGINESAIGTAQLRMVFHGFAPTDALDEKVRFIDDTVNVFSKSFLGLTVSCARCHDHKFDAISQADYYALFGVFASCRPGREVIDVPSHVAENHDQLVSLKTEIRKSLARAWTQQMPRLQERLFTRNWNRHKETDEIWRPLAELDREVDAEGARRHWRKHFAVPDPADSGGDSARQTWSFDGSERQNSWYAHGFGLQDQPVSAGHFALAMTGTQVLEGIYPSGVYSHLLSSKHPARFTSPDYMIGDDEELWVRALGDGESTVRYAIQDYPRSGTVFPVRPLKPRWEWVRFDLAYWAGDSMYVELVTAQDAPLLVKDSDRSWFGVSEVKVQRKGDPPPQTEARAIDAVADAGKKPPANWTELAQRYVEATKSSIDAWSRGEATDAQALLLDEMIRGGWLANDLESLSETAALVQKYRQLEAEVPVPTRVPGLDETRGRQQPLYVRGNHKKPGDIVPRRFLEAIDDRAYDTERSGRLQLADDLVRDDNPLTRRVIVNRLWHHLFGAGIVPTTDNFGRLGEEPSHPELLDYLAGRFSDDGWSLKKMIRFLVTSQTWQQSSTPSHEAQRLDPGNRWLSHAHLRRMEAEAVRDTLLAASGVLERHPVGGPPVAGESNRRSVYVKVVRNSLDPFLRAFDFPEPFSTTGRRDVTNVPAQSLTMMNSPLVARYASSLARSLRQEENLANDSQRVQHLFLRLLSREPSEGDLTKTRSYLEESRAWWRRQHEHREALQQTLQQHQEQRTRLIERARQRLLAERETTSSSKTSDAQAESFDAVDLVSPRASWDFNRDMQDQAGKLHGQAHGDAYLEDGALVLSGGHVTTPRLEEKLAEKTLEAWVQLENLRQRGGGVVSVQTAQGQVFDSIVFGEQESRHWIAGSDFFRRTQAFGGNPEQEADQRYVHLAIVYHEDGRIVGYRDGQRYGEAYQSEALQEFGEGDAIISFGVRHLPAGGNRLLRGRIDQANLYDRALTDRQIAASFQRGTDRVTQRELFDAMTPTQREQYVGMTEEIERIREQLQNLPSLDGQPIEQAVWKDLVHAMLILKEFIYVQ